MAGTQLSIVAPVHTTRRSTIHSTKVNLPPQNQLEGLIWLEFCNAPPPNSGVSKRVDVHLRPRSRSRQEGGGERARHTRFRTRFLVEKLSHLRQSPPQPRMLLTNPSASEWTRARSHPNGVIKSDSELGSSSPRHLAAFIRRKASV